MQIENCGLTDEQRNNGLLCKGMYCEKCKAVRLKNIKQKYYWVEIQNSKDYLLFWKKDANGYSVNIDEAGLFEEVDRKFPIYFAPNIDMFQNETIAIPKEYIEKFGKKIMVIKR